MSKLVHINHALSPACSYRTACPRLVCSLARNLESDIVGSVGFDLKCRRSQVEEVFSEQLDHGQSLCQLNIVVTYVV